MSDTRIKAAQFFGVVGHGTDGYFLMTNADGSMSWAEGGSAGPSVTSVSYPGDDTAADPAGLQTVVLTGTNFGSSMTVSIGGTLASSVAHDSSTQLTITTPQKAAGDYDIVVTNAVTGASGTFVNGISYNGVPTWTTATGSLGTFESETTISTITLQATEPDGGTITFNITNGALPTGLSLTGANIDGTTTAESSTTLYSFTIEAIDDENQSTPRNFSITVNSPLYFAPVLYTGNSTNDQSITGVGFQPDFVWIKSRNTGTGTAYHGLWDSVRGTGGHLYASVPNAETNTPNRLYSFDSDGFSLGNGSDPEYIGNNNYVAWCWKAGGVPTPNNNTDGTITSTVSANQNAGFSIVKWTTNSPAGLRVGHGLGTTPNLIFYKRLDNGTEDWYVFSSVIDGSYLILNSTAAKTSTRAYSTFATPTLIDSFTGVVGVNYVAYCFHSVDGYQKVGSYTGTGGAFTVTTGFQPRFVMIKRADDTGNWVIIDSQRVDTTAERLYANEAYAGDANQGETFSATGFSPRTSSTADTNIDGGEYIYLAIA